MRLFHQSPAQSLAEWLDMATQDLVPSAQARIRAEIEAHYNEAVQTRVANGSSESEANATALTDLGNPKTAARRFCREYLTVRTARSLATHVKSAQNGFTLLAMFGIVLGVFLVYALNSWGFDGARLQHGPLHQIVWVVQLLVLASGIPSCIAEFVVAKRQMTNRRRCQIIVLRGVTSTNMSLIQLMTLLTIQAQAAHSLPDLFRDISFALCYASFFVFAVTQLFGILRLRKKILAANESDFPPPCPTVA